AFMVLEFFMDLPWHEKRDPKKDGQDIYNMKSVLFKQAKGGHSPMSFKPVPYVTNKEFYAQILQEIDKMTIVDDLDKTKIREIVEGVFKDMGKKAKEIHKFTPKDPKDEFLLPLVWEGKVIPEKATKKSDGKEEDEARKEKLAKIKKMEKEICKVMRELDEAQEEKKEKSRSDRGRRRSGGRKKKGYNDEEDDYEDNYDNEDDDVSYEDERDRKKPPSVARKARSQDKKDRKRSSTNRPSLKRDTRRRTHTRADVSNMGDISNDVNGRGKGASAERIDEKDGGRKEKRNDKEAGTPVGGSKERLGTDSKENIGTDSKEKIGEGGSKEKMSAEQIPAASPIK
ncbi:hypothetical protein PRIPAC_72743, partial [Pristionchus pacificus]